MKSRKQINLGTVAGDKEAADGGVGFDLFIGSDRLVSRKVKRHGKRTLTILQSLDEPSSESDVDIDDAVLADCVKVLRECTYGKGTDDDECAVFAKFENGHKAEERPPCGSCNGKWHRPLTAEPPYCVPLPIPFPSGGDHDQEEDVEPCEICYGRHKRCPLTKELPFGCPFPDINPLWYVACKCCRGWRFVEKTDDCARCGSIKKKALRKFCSVCCEIGHLDQSDKQCLYHGREVPVKKPFFSSPPPSPPARIKKSRQPSSRKKLAKKQKVDDAAA